MANDFLFFPKTAEVVHQESFELQPLNSEKNDASAKDDSTQHVSVQSNYEAQEPSVSETSRNSLSDWMKHNICKESILKPERFFLPNQTHQLLAEDIYVGFSVLERLQKDKKRKLAFFLSTMEQQSNNPIKDFITAHKEKLCFTIINIDKNHYFYIFAYYPTNGEPQILIIDPAPLDEGKKNNKTKIINFFNKLFNNKVHLNYVDLVQTNMRDCAIACLQAAKDAIENNAVFIKDQQLILQAEKFTLNDSQEDFEKIREAIREEWENELEEHDHWFMFYADGTQEKRETYSFVNNKKRQRYYDYVMHLAGAIVQHVTMDYAESKTPSFLHINPYPTLMDIKQEFEAIEALVKADPKYNLYVKIITELLEINKKFPDEDITNEHYDKVELSLRLTQCVVKLDAEKFEKILKNNFDRLKFVFLDYLKTQTIIRENKINDTPQNLDELYKQFKQKKDIAKIFDCFPKVNTDFLKVLKDWLPTQIMEMNASVPKTQTTSSLFHSFAQSFAGTITTTIDDAVTSILRR